jgi:hypothetical protein
MFNRRNAFLGWVVLQVAKRKLRKGRGAGRASGLLRGLGRVTKLAALAGVGAVVAKRLRQRGGSTPL